MKPYSVAILLLLAVNVGAWSWAADPAGAKIKKCQDAAGKWHYGDTAAAECAKSKVIEITSEGVPVKEVSAPLSEEQLKARELQRATQEEEKKRLEEQQRRDRLLLATYGHEDDIIQTRDRKLAEIEAQIGASNETLTTLRAAFARYQAQAAEESRASGRTSAQTANNLAKTGSQIARQENLIQGKREEQETARRQFQADLERFRELKTPKAAPPVPPAPKSP
jgi:hypothetical protein